MHGSLSESSATPSWFWLSSWEIARSRVRHVSCAKIATATDPAQEVSIDYEWPSAYSPAVGNVLGHQGERVDYAQLIKIYAMDVPEDMRRYSPPHSAEAIPTPVYGYPRETDLRVAC